MCFDFVSDQKSKPDMSTDGLKNENNMTEPVIESATSHENTLGKIIIKHSACSHININIYFFSLSGPELSDLETADLTEKLDENIQLEPCEKAGSLNKSSVSLCTLGK